MPTPSTHFPIAISIHLHSLPYQQPTPFHSLNCLLPTPSCPLFIQSQHLPTNFSLQTAPFWCLIHFLYPASTLLTSSSTANNPSLITHPFPSLNHPHSPTVATHDLQNEAALVGIGSGSDGIHSLNDTVECRVCADGHVSAAEVIVDGAHHTHNVEVRVGLALLLRDLTYNRKEMLSL